jgi:hypothetical protein
VKYVGGLAIPPSAYLLHEIERQENEARLAEYVRTKSVGDTPGIHAVFVAF